MLGVVREESQDNLRAAPPARSAAFWASGSITLAGSLALSVHLSTPAVISLRGLHGDRPIPAPWRQSQPRRERADVLRRHLVPRQIPAGHQSQQSTLPSYVSPPPFSWAGLRDGSDLWFHRGWWDL